MKNNTQFEIYSRFSTPSDSEKKYPKSPIKKSKEKMPDKNEMVDELTIREHRKKVYDSIYKGQLAESKNLFLNPGYRGINIYQYPKHIKKMVDEINHKVSKKNP